MQYTIMLPSPSEEHLYFFNVISFLYIYSYKKSYQIQPYVGDRKKNHIVPLVMSYSRKNYRFLCIMTTCFLNNLVIILYFYLEYSSTIIWSIKKDELIFQPIFFSILTFFVAHLKNGDIINRHNSLFLKKGAINFLRFKTSPSQREKLQELKLLKFRFIFYSASLGHNTVLKQCDQVRLTILQVQMS